MEKYAILRANHLAEIDSLKHDSNSDFFGENLYQLSTTQKEADINFCRSAIDYWYAGVFNYSYNKPGFDKTTGHFTQVVWKESDKLGCAKSKSKISGNYYVVCNYYSHGNVKGTFEQMLVSNRMFYR